MKKGFYYIVLIFVIISCSTTDQQKGDDERIQTFSELSDKFTDPPAIYRTAPFKVWNGEVTRQKIDSQLVSMKAQGIGGVFIHPRWGMITEYIDSNWYELVEYTVNKGKELDMKVWLYDENSFPSGFAGGHVAAEMPESYNQGQGLKVHRLEKLPENTAHFFIVQEMKDGEITDITDNTEEYKGTAGDFIAYEKIFFRASERYGEYSYVDLIVSGVTEKFIEVTMEGYENTISDEFGKAVPGIFTDEPNIAPPDRKAIRWAPDLFEIFKNKWGYDLKDHLISLVEERGEWKRVRHNYYQILLQMFIDRWSKPWYNYTEKHHLKWTGHYWEHGWPAPYHGGDNMAMYAWHQVPGIDMLFNDWNKRPDQFGNIRNVKELISVANQMGRSRTLSETYGASGWELGFEDMKRNGDWQTVLGVNLMNQHLSYMDIYGDRKHDFPQSFSYHTPWWHLYHELADYYARLCLATSAGEQINDILIIEPTTTGWMYYSMEQSNEKLEKMKDRFHELLEILEENQIEYDLGSENMIKDHGKAVDGKFIINQREYSMIILPPMFENMDFATFQVLSDYISQNGKIMSLGSIPSLIDGVETQLIKQLLTTHPDVWTQAENIFEVIDDLKHDDITFNIPEQNKHMLFHQRRILQDGQILLLTNSRLSSSSWGEVIMKGHSVKLLNPHTGHIEKYPYSGADNGKVQFSFDLSPAGSLLLYISDRKDQLVNINKDNKNTDTLYIPVEKLDIKPLNDNVLPLDYCWFEIDGKKYEKMHFFDATQNIFKHFGFDANPWSVSVQYKTNILDRDTFTAGSGVKVYYDFMVDYSFDAFNTTKLTIERPELWKVSINGKEVKPLEGEWFLDRQNGVYAIGEYIQVGQNVIGIECSPMSIHAEVEPVYITGNFGIEHIKKGSKITTFSSLETGPWTAQKMPFYHDGVRYSSILDNPEQQTRYHIILNRWKGSVAEVKVNGQYAGIIGWKPYELDITKFLTREENQIDVIVYGTLKNLLGPHHNVESHGFVTPWSWRFAPAGQPSGIEYDVIDYGLFDHYSIMKIK